MRRIEIWSRDGLACTVHKVLPKRLPLELSIA